MEIKMEDFELVMDKKPKLDSPKMIEGLPGIGNVGRIAVDFLVDKLKAKKFMTMYSKTFPNTVFMNDDSTVTLPSIDFFYSKKPNIIFVVGDIQTASENDSYSLVDKILQVAEQFGVSEIITIGGIGLGNEPSSPSVHGAGTNKEMVKKLKKMGVKCDGANTVGLIIGATGMLLGMASIKGIQGFSMLAQTLGHPTHFGFRAARSVLKVLQKYLGLEFPLDDIEKEIKHIEKKRKSKNSKLKSLQKGGGMRYIG
jgi:uncharacterized protein (TIGR00162 family)